MVMLGDWGPKVCREDRENKQGSCNSGTASDTATQISATPTFQEPGEETAASQLTHPLLGLTAFVKQNKRTCCGLDTDR